MPTLWHNASHSSMLCEVKTIVRDFAAVEMTSHKNRFASGSIPVDGSSNKTTHGAPTRAKATESFLFMPPEYVPHMRSAASNNLISFKSFDTVSSIYDRGTPRIAAYNLTCSLPVKFNCKPSNCGQYPMRCLEAFKSFETENKARLLDETLLTLV